MPITNPFDQGSASLGEAVSRIAGDRNYQTQFITAFGRGVNEQDMLRAIATYERTLVLFDLSFDHFIAGDAGAISDAAKRGWELFNTQARCNRCHALTEQQRDTTVFTDNDFHNIGIGISGTMWSPWRGRQSVIWRQGISGKYRRRGDHQRDVGPRTLSHYEKAE